MSNVPRAQSNVSYQLFALSISLLALLLLGVNAAFQLNPQTQVVFEYADTSICVLFLVDFLITLAHSERKLRYLATWGWLDLLSSIPMVDVFRVGRLARVVRIVRAIRGFRASRILAHFILGKRAQSAFLVAGLISLLLLVFGIVAILQFEQGPEANIRGPEQALWWSVATVMGINYGDLYPLSSEGRVVAAILGIAGMALFGTLSGFVAAWFMAPVERQQENDIELLRREIQDLKSLLERRFTDHIG